MRDPSFSTRTNADRAETGFRLVQTHTAQFPDTEYEGDDGETQLCDILADLMHYAKEQAIDFYRAYAMAQTHFNEECDEERKD